MHELNIGHSIVARAIMVGFEEAVREMKRLVTGGLAGDVRSQRQIAPGVRRRVAKLTTDH